MVLLECVAGLFFLRKAFEVLQYIVFLQGSKHQVYSSPACGVELFLDTLGHAADYDKLEVAGLLKLLEIAYTAPDAVLGSLAYRAGVYDYEIGLCVGCDALPSPFLQDKLQGIGLCLVHLTAVCLKKIFFHSAIFSSMNFLITFQSLSSGITIHAPLSKSSPTWSSARPVASRFV